jgi:hypothetical protein
MNQKLLTLTAILLTAGAPAFAIQRQQTTTRTCSDVQALVRAQGEVILQYSGRSGVPLYDRAVADRDRCIGSGYGQQTYMPTRDKANCAVWVCKQGAPDLRP